MKSIVVVIVLIAIVLIALYLISLNPRYDEADRKVIIGVVEGFSILDALLIMWLIYCIAC